MKQYFLITIICFVLICNVFGQLSTKEKPISLNVGISDLKISEKAQKTLPSLDMGAIEQEDKEDEVNGIPPRFGFRHEVDYNLDNSGEWTILANGDKIWRLSISCPNALSINLLYDKFWIPDSTKFFIYSNDFKHSIGAFTSVNNKGDKDNIQGFATGLVFGDQITLEYYVPKEVDEISVISIAYVVHGYRYILSPNNTKSYESSAICNINVNCGDGWNWQSEKNAIALILVDGNRYCTGSLINTTANDNRPLFLTADHCLGGWANDYIKYDALSRPNLPHYSFYWHYESPFCENVGEPERISTSGATVIANNSDTDFALLQLTENPINNQDTRPYYLGWDRSENAGTSGVCIHHPAGDVKKISSYNNNQNYSSRINWTDGSYSLPNTHWKTTFYNGFLEGGSSGSPLLNSNRKVIGQLHGGVNAACNKNYSKYYGKFNVSWTGNGSTENHRKLHPWLDPLNTGATTVNGSSELGYLDNAVIEGSDKLFLCDTYTYQFIEALPENYGLYWEVSSNMAIISGQSTSSVDVQVMDIPSSQIGIIRLHIHRDGVVIKTITKPISFIGTATGFTNLFTRDIEIYGNTTWSGQKALGVKATVYPGGILTITGTIACAENVQIIVQPGGKLIIDGGKLTNSCSGKMWTGILVFGQRDKPQLPEYQGTVELKNNAVIEHALIAISAAPTG
ncbi:MAG: serine protease, partial [Bacteroidales bacterium]|nr:serine protease [Bacteroidales bacterium]